jgi:hypothetical protein
MTPQKKRQDLFLSERGLKRIGALSERFDAADKTGASPLGLLLRAMISEIRKLRRQLRKAERSPKDTRPVITKKSGVKVFGSRCILVTSCPTCRAKKGAPCTGKSGPMGETHVLRREAAARIHDRARATRVRTGQRVKRTRPYRHPS